MKVYRVIAFFEIGAMLGGLVWEEGSKYSGKRECQKGESMEVWEQDD